MKEFKLDNHPKIEPGFKIPPNYFEDFSKTIIGKIQEPEVKVVSLFEKRRQWFLAAAAVLVLALLLPVLNNLTAKSETTDTAIEDYLSYHAQLSEEDIVNLLDTEDIEKIKIEYNIGDKAMEDVLSANSNLENLIY